MLTHPRTKLTILAVAGLAAAVVPAAVVADELLAPQAKMAAKSTAKAPISAAKTMPVRRLALADRRSRWSNDFWSGQWMADLVARVIDPSPAAQRRPRIVRRTAVTTPTAPKLVVATPEATPAQETVPAVVTAPIEARPSAPPAAVLRIVPVPTITIHPTPGDLVVTKASPITTGTVIAPAPLPPQTTSDTSQMLMSHAERTQASHDLVKLELANRTYTETAQSGQSAFEKRQDWRLLERARDAMTSAELSAAESVGFESNAYINEAEKTIVVAIAGTQDLRRDFLTADIWQALIKSEAPQQFFMAKSYVRSIMMRYQARGFTTECVGHSLGGGACAYAAAELGIRALVVNPIAAGRMPAGARHLVRNYVVDGDIAQLVYAARGNEFIGDITIINDGQHEARTRAVEKYGPLAGPILVVRDLRQSVKSHMLGYALDRIAEHAGVERQR